MRAFEIQPIADLERARQDKVAAGKPVSSEPASDMGTRLDLAVASLEYNQGFVTFLDGKANSLLLVNSIFLATSATAKLSAALAWAPAAAAVLAVLLSLGVLWARGTEGSTAERGQIFFFQHILRRRAPSGYADDLRQVSGGEVLEATARQVHALAGVVEKKFQAYRLAQGATVLSALLWIAGQLGPLLG